MGNLILLSNESGRLHTNCGDALRLWVMPSFAGSLLYALDWLKAAMWRNSQLVSTFWGWQLIILAAAITPTSRLASTLLLRSYAELEWPN